MPGFNGTGPRGQGAFTGGGRGYCVGSPVQGNAAMVPMRGGFGYGRGFGRGYGMGRGFGRGQGFGRAVPAYGNAYGANINSQNEVEVLREQALYLQEEAKAINARLKELESSSGSSENK
ncbi:MAG: DUF5320 domain-containing protein [Candidatus Susulua stagnicola]|nr:DUF5320 domain-containing protein [Candidatus Susulua stagnicola]